MGLWEEEGVDKGVRGWGWERGGGGESKAVGGV